MHRNIVLDVHAFPKRKVDRDGYLMNHRRARLILLVVTGFLSTLNLFEHQKFTAFAIAKRLMGRYGLF